jgi:hypothetical protein
VSHVDRESASELGKSECRSQKESRTGRHFSRARLYPAWYAHITLAMAAATFLTITRATELGKKGL